jgi:hypothetical protein
MNGYIIQKSDSLLINIIHRLKKKYQFYPIIKAIKKRLIRMKKTNFR